MASEYIVTLNKKFAAIAYDAINKWHKIYRL